MFLAAFLIPKLRGCFCGRISLVAFSGCIFETPDISMWELLRSVIQQDAGVDFAVQPNPTLPYAQMV